jgi:hypothetical protein
MKSKLSMLVGAGLLLVSMTSLSGCTGRSVNHTRSWFIQSYDNGVFKVQHEGYTYKATCDISQSFNNATSITDPNNVVEFSTCDTAIGLVGHEVQPFDGKERDLDGSIVMMWSVGHKLALRSWKNEQTPWRQEEFKITSIERSNR